MGDIINLEKHRKEKEALAKRAAEEASILQARLLENVSLGHLMTTLGYITTQAGVTEPQEQLDMLCQTLFGVDEKDILALYQRQGSSKKGSA